MAVAVAEERRGNSIGGGEEIFSTQNAFILSYERGSRGEQGRGRRGWGNMVSIDFLFTWATGAQSSADCLVTRRGQ